MSDYSSNFPTQRPKLNLVFNSGSGKLDSRISYSRSSTGTYMSNEKHLSSENLLRYSNPNNALWVESKNATITSNSVSAPDGSATASKITEDSTAGVQHRSYISQTVGSGETFTYVGYLKANGRTIVQLSTTGAGASAGVEFNLSGSGTATTRSGSPTNASITQIGTDWYKCSFQVSSTSSALLYTQIVMCDAANSTVYDGDGTSGVYAWGFSLSTTGETVLNETSGSIHREFASTLKTVSADEPRFEYSATDGQSEGLLIEAQAVNLQRYGSDFASWSIKANLVPHSNQAIAPNGLLEADLMVPTTGNDYHYIYDGQASVASGTTYTFSVYLKSAGYRYAQLLALGPLQSSGHVTYDLEAGTLSASGAHSGTIESVGNGWYRASATVTAASTTTSGFLIAGADSLSNGRNPQTTGNAYDGWLCWGAQLETGSSASSLVDTGTGSSQLSRAADSCSVVDATLFNSGEHTIIWEGDLNATTVDARMANLTDGSTDNRVRLDYDNGSSARFIVESDDVLGVNVSYTTDLSVGTHKVAGTLKTNEAQLIVDGTRRQLDTSAVVPSGLDQLAIMKTFNGSSSVHDGNGHCKRLTYYNVALSQAEAESLTSNP